MPSGTHLTVEDRDRILRLAGQRESDGSWRLSYHQIAAEMHLQYRTVSTVIRLAAVRWGEEHAWRADPR